MSIQEFIQKCREVVTREIPVHDHTHSLYVRCLSCQMFGINLPTKFSEAAVCGNCFSLETVKYYPPCCIVNDRESVKPLLDKLEEAVKVIDRIDKTLRVPAAEYVPAISDVFTIIDEFLERDHERS